MNAVRYLLGLLLAVPVLVCAGARACNAAQVRPVYVEAMDYPGPGEGGEAFADLEQRLAHDFERLCGDTFCAGDYSAYRPLRYRCSVRQHDGVIGQCVWTFGASEASIDPDTGRVLVDARLWQCTTPLPSQTRLAALYKALAGQRPLLAPLPHQQRSINDGLMDCLSP
ncbi:hypothetical protein [Xanthomonas sp. GPE 39]|uniref:hypothetical protein n=1 Tax=Xanthomonas sp. GPE 39 TaxID=1583099 RepID=UPI0005F2A224|nr:hypothetical protein [Xanthomonas sp. GPE 39]